MMAGQRRFWFALLLSICLLVIPTACNLSKPTCTEDELLRPGDLAPNNEMVNPMTQLNLTWTYPESDCHFDYFSVTMGSSTDNTEIFNGWTVSEEKRNLIWPGVLEPGNTYFWRVIAVVESDSGHYIGPHELSWFYTGPLCAYDATLLAPILLTENYTEFELDEEFLLVWDDPTPCQPGRYVAEISKYPNFSELAYDGSPMGAMTEFMAYPGWAAENFEQDIPYYWRVRAARGTHSWGPYSEVRIFCVGECPLELHIHGSGVPKIPPSAKVLEAASCRSGPGLDYPIVEYFSPGQSLTVEGRNQESSWWWVLSLTLKDHCWLSNRLVEITGDVSQVQVVQALPPPTQVPSPTVGMVGCLVWNANMQKNVCMAPCPPDAKSNGACIP